MTKKKPDYKEVVDKKLKERSGFITMRHMYEKNIDFTNSMTALGFVGLFLGLAFSIAFDLLKWDVASIVASVVMFVAILVVAGAQYMNFRFTSYKSKIAQKIYDLEIEIHTIEMNNKVAVVGNDEKPVKVNVVDVINVSVNTASKELRKDLQTEVVKIKAELALQSKKNKRK